MHDRLTAGDTLNFTYTSADYPASAGWVLKLRLVQRGQGVPVTVTGAASGADHRVTVASAVTSTWQPGAYGWAVWVEKAGERFTLQSGQCVIAADPAQAEEAADSRTHARKMLDAIEAVLEGRATSAQAEYEIAGRRVKYIPMAELMQLRSQYAWMVKNEAPTSTAGRLLVRL